MLSHRFASYACRISTLRSNKGSYNWHYRVSEQYKSSITTYAERSRIWDILGGGEAWHIAGYAAHHFKQHKRPLRIAVDEACWRFTNLTPEQVEKIRRGEPAANPVEKVILWRILRLLKLNIQLIFVNDGMHRPWKRGKRGTKLDYELVRLSHQLFDALKIPRHQAPGEAEAECARMQALSIVDAVWSDDSDTLMFGCRTLIGQHKIGKKPVKDHICGYRAESILKDHNLNPESLVLFAMLSGGDYNTSGLRGCGSQTAAQLARTEPHLAQTLYRADKSHFHEWRHMLRLCLGLHRKSIDVPDSFPDLKALNNYRHPKVSSDEQLRCLRGLKEGWERPINQLPLRIMLRDRFNFSTREFIKHLTPIFLCRALARIEPGQASRNLEFNVVLKRTMKKGDVEQGMGKAERRVTFSPLPFLEIDVSRQPPNEDWSKLTSKDGTPYDATQDIECEVLECLLKHGLPNEVFTSDFVKQPLSKTKRKSCDGESQIQRPRKKTTHQKHDSSRIRQTKDDDSREVTSLERASGSVTSSQ